LWPCADLQSDRPAKQNPAIGMAFRQPEYALAETVTSVIILSVANKFTPKAVAPPMFPAQHRRPVQAVAEQTGPLSVGSRQRPPIQTKK
jgi:hypothetical protein